MSHLCELSLAALPTLNYLKAYITNGQSLTGGSVFRKIAFDTPIFNDCFTEASDVFTCTKAGFYYLTVAIYNEGNPYIQWLTYVKNGVALVSPYYEAGSYFVSGTHLDLAKLFRLEVGDTIEIQAYVTFTISSLLGGDELRSLKMVRITG